MNISKIKLNKGFTLIELLVVISIIGLLSSIVLAGLQDARAKARDSARIRSMIETRTALQMYFSDKGYYPQMNVTAPSGYLDVNSQLWKNGNGYGLVNLGYIKDIHPEIRYFTGRSNSLTTYCTTNTSTTYKCTLARITVKLERGNNVLISDRDYNYDSTSIYLPDGLSDNLGCTPKSGITATNDLCFDIELK